jgi:hypothetical protein
MKKIIISSLFSIIALISFGQTVNKTMSKLPDTGEINSYTNTFGEDADYTFYAPFFINNGNGTVTDTITGLMWQKTDGGEMTIENATIYCDTFTLGGFSNWRLPNAQEAFSIINHQYSNPAINPAVFSTTAAEYWWSSDRQANDNNNIWVTNSGGGIGNHPKTETISAGGIKRIHVRAVRDVSTPSVITSHFTNNGNGTITDNLTNLIWQDTPYTDTLTWEQALVFAESLSFGGYTDWRLPNIKELQSINDVSIINPSITPTFFNNIGIKKFWSSTTLPNQTTRAWYLHSEFGITTYDDKTKRNSIICVRGNQNIISSVNENSFSNFASIYPNPAENSINILCAEVSEGEISNIQGQLVKSFKTNDSLTKIDISSFPKGVYFVKVFNEKSPIIWKFIKN